MVKGENLKPAKDGGRKTADNATGKRVGGENLKTRSLQMARNNGNGRRVTGENLKPAHGRRHAVGL